MKACFKELYIRRCFAKWFIKTVLTPAMVLFDRIKVKNNSSNSTDETIYRVEAKKNNDYTSELKLCQTGP